MILIFIVTLFSTLVVTRITAHKLHDMKNYGTKNEKSKTLTGIIRKKTGVDIHHFHFGVLGLIVILPIIYFNGMNNLLAAMLGVSLSLISDQITPICKRKYCYFNKKRILESVSLHILIAIIAIIILT
jgi:hypothetical protein